MANVGKNIAGPLLFLNLVLYVIVVGFAGWAINRYINGQTYHPSLGGNGATTFFLTFAILASVLGIVSKFIGGTHIRFWRSDSLAAAGSLSIVAWAVTALSFGFACKEIALGGHRGWRLRVVEGLIIVLTFTQLLYVLLIHAGMFSGRYGPDYGMGATSGDPLHKGTGAGAGGAAAAGTRV